MSVPASPLITRLGRASTIVVRGASGDGNDEVHTDYYAAIAAGPSPTKLIIIPGNPGVVDFYTTFVDSLFQEYNGRFTIICISHAGHGAPGLNGERVFTVEDQIQHKIQFLTGLKNGDYDDVFGPTTVSSPATATRARQQQQAAQPHQFFLLSHSIGAYISLKTRARSPGLPIAGVVGMMPTIRNLWQGFTIFVKTFTSWPFREAISLVGHWFPVPIAHLVARFGTDAEFSHQLDGVLRNKLTFYTLFNILYMAHLEGRDILEVDAELRETLTKYSKETIMYYSTRDAYTPQDFIEEFREEFPAVNVYLADSDIEHAFVSRSNHARSVAKRMAGLMMSHQWQPSQ